jgi:hypothetical protein
LKIIALPLYLSTLTVKERKRYILNVPVPTN